MCSQIMAALAVSLGSMTVGFSSGYTSPALPSMKDRNITDFPVTDSEVSCSHSHINNILYLQQIFL